MIISSSTKEIRLFLGNKTIGLKNENEDLKKGFFLKI